MPRTLILLGLAVAAPAFAGPAFASEFAPNGNAATLARSFALPALGEGLPLARGHSETRWTLDVANEYVAEGNCAVECIVLDGETARLRLTHRRGLGAGWDFSSELTLLDRGGGFLDGWIQDWHDWFGLPNGGRERTPDGQYVFHYERQNTVLFDYTSGGTGMSDLTLAVGRRWGRASAVRAMAKLPTGDDGDLEGGTAGAALWVERALSLPPNWSGYAALGGSYSERGAVLPEMQNRSVVFGGLGIAAPLTRAVRLTAQLQMHGKLYHGSELTPLTRGGSPLSLGLQYRTGPRGSVELGFQEDPSVNGSPDFAIYLSVRS